MEGRSIKYNFLWILFYGHIYSLAWMHRVSSVELWFCPFVLYVKVALRIIFGQVSQVICLRKVWPWTFWLWFTLIYPVVHTAKQRVCAGGKNASNHCYYGKNSEKRKIWNLSPGEVVVVREANNNHPRYCLHLVTCDFQDCYSTRFPPLHFQKIVSKAHSF